jgi:hypothetical protein
MVPLQNLTFPISIIPSNEKIDEDGSVIKTNKSKHPNNPDQSPSVKSKNKNKNTTNNQQQTVNQAQSPANATPSIAKYINQNKRDNKSIPSVPLTNEQNVFKSNIVAEKRICSYSDESNVKRLKLEDLNSKVTSEQQFKKSEDDISDNCQNKENSVECITLE